MWKLKMSVLPSLVYRFNVIPIKIPARCFVNSDKNYQVYMEMQKTQNNQHNIDKEEQSWRTDTMQLQDFL